MTTKPTWTISEYFLDHQHRTEARRRRNKLIAIGFSVSVLTVVGIVSMFYALIMTDFLRSDATTGAVSDPKLSVLTTTQAYNLALASAQAWQQDATLLKASATWTLDPSQGSLRDGAETWSFSFYSPGRKRSANYSVIDGAPKMINSQSLGTPIEPSPVDGWTIDSDIAVLRMLDEGGQAFLDNNEINTVTMTLTAGAYRGRPEWLITAYGSNTARYYNMRLDASNGQVLDTYSSS